MTAPIESFEEPPRRGDTVGQIDWIVRAIGTENDDADGGQGLFGRVARLESRMTRMDAFLNRVLGGFAVVGMVAGFVFIFVKVLVAAVLNGGRP